MLHVGLRSDRPVRPVRLGLIYISLLGLGLLDLLVLLALVRFPAHSRSNSSFPGSLTVDILVSWQLLDDETDS